METARILGRCRPIEEQRKIKLSHYTPRRPLRGEEV
jgi:hypothetical protein